MSAPTELSLKERREDWIATNPLRVWRTDRRVGFSLQDAASTLGRAPGTIQHWEYGSTAPDEASLAAIARLIDDETLPARWEAWLAERPLQ